MTDPQPGTPCVVHDWHPHYAGLTGTISELLEDGHAVVRLDGCGPYPRGYFAIISLAELERQPKPAQQEERRHAPI